MDIKDDSFITLYKAAYEAKCDLYVSADILPDISRFVNTFSLPDVKTVLFLPGTFPRSRFAGSYGKNDSGNSGFFLTADIRQLGGDEFRSFAEKQGYTSFIVPFAELCDPGEYGYRPSYGWFAEWRASSPFPFHLTLLLSSYYEFDRHFPDYYASPSFTAVTASDKPFIKSYCCHSAKSKLYRAADLAESVVGKRTAVLFPTRREAEIFRAFMAKRDTPTCYINGTTDAEHFSACLKSFHDGRSILIGTKSVLSAALFIRAEQVICCGVPYSPAHLSRCAALSSTGTLTCVYCEEDFALAENVAKWYYPDEDRLVFLNERIEALDNVRKLLEE